MSHIERVRIPNPRFTKQYFAHRMRLLMTIVMLLHFGFYVRPASTASANQIVQITRSLNANGTVTSISGDGSVVALNQQTDPLGLNPDHTSEVFLINSDGSGLRQISKSDGISLSARLSADGTRIAFRSTGDLVPGQNRDHNFELFTADTSTLTFRQLTRSNNGSVPDLDSISADGSLIAFSATANYTGRNPHGEDQVFLINSDGSGLKQLTDGRSKDFLNFAPEISGDGSRIAFLSTDDPLGTNGDHSVEVFSMRSDGSELHQLSAFSPLNNRDGFPTLSISSDGSLIAFDSDFDPVGTNGDQSFEIFTVNADGTGLAQITNSLDDSYAPCLRGNGMEITFLSGSDFTGANPTFQEQVFRANSNGTGIVQLTNSTGGGASTAPSFSADGSRVAYSTSADFLGTNPDLNQEGYAFKRDGTMLVQLTQTTLYAHQRATISGQGSRVAFDSQANLTCPTCSNADHNRELFIANADGTGLRQLTNTLVANDASVAPDLSSDGSIVVFQSLADPFGTNPDHRPEVFTVNADGTNLRQVTITNGQSRDPVISRDGRFIAFSSNGNFVGSNADHGFEIYRVGISGTCTDGGPSLGCVQLTNLAPSPVLGTTRFPSISGDGSRVIFESAVNITGGNGDGNVEVYAVNGNGSGLTQLTSTISPPNRFGIQRAWLSANGTTVVFGADVDPFGTNPDRSREIFAVGFDGAGLRQLTFGPSLFGSFTPTITADGRQIVFQSFSNDRGRNREETVQIFLINSDGSALRQLTTGLTVSTRPVINDDGSRVVFFSNENFTGENGDFSPEVFVMSLKALGK